MPVRVSAKVAAPVWFTFSPPVPLMPPEKVVSAVSRVLSVLLPSVMAPAPDKLPIVSLPDSASVAPPATATLLLVEIASPPLTVRVPADTVVAPE
ncbi:hypothetical protein D3C85_519000 [compost metagenome]